jgi:hypothetical protein
LKIIEKTFFSLSHTQTLPHSTTAAGIRTVNL